MSEESFEVYRATGNMKEAFPSLLDEVRWKKWREREQFLRNKDPGAATIERSRQDAALYRDKGTNVLVIGEGINPWMELPDAFKWRESGSIN
jgi:hypothetical protein